MKLDLGKAAEMHRIVLGAELIAKVRMSMDRKRRLEDFVWSRLNRLPEPSLRSLVRMEIRGMPDET